MIKPNDQELEEWLNEFTIEYPSEEKIEQTIAMLHHYVPKKKKVHLFRQVYKELLGVSRVFWMTNLIYLAAGIGFIFIGGGNPYITLFLLAPLPVLISLIDVFRGRDEGMIELELSFKHSPSQLILSKLATIGLFNLVCNVLLIAVIHIFTEHILLSSLLKYWVVPYMVSISLCLFLSIKFRAVFAAPISIAILFSLGMAISQMAQVYEAVPTGMFLFLFMAALFVLGLEVKMIYKGAYHEFSD
ncbi:hypothetical protein QNH39_04660 [Neobacillus novalis]|uniref:Uncharacterized protein n=1 Tax=Neobacillus novalis TaxID=220687 RepID=A0AA95MSU7_9BACI|nr:hypothetical protein [Neobacillus novalis]WHY87158.1 hypothetical protein QNH39_04660 [Neobacillus novalis]